VPSCRRPRRLLSRSDIFKPLLQEAYADFEAKERAAMATGEGVKATWQVRARVRAGACV
jgi:hypothetical protein